MCSCYRVTSIDSRIMASTPSRAVGAASSAWRRAIADGLDIKVDRLKKSRSFDPKAA